MWQTLGYIVGPAPKGEFSACQNSLGSEHPGSLVRS